MEMEMEMEKAKDTQRASERAKKQTIWFTSDVRQLESKREREKERRKERERERKLDGAGILRWN